MRLITLACCLLSISLSTASAATPAAVVFFTTWSGLLDDPAEQVIRSAASTAKTTSGPIEVLGYADPTGSTAANNLLSQLRAQLVRDELVTNGVSADRIKVVPKGSTEFVDTANESRRVLIRFEN